MDQIPLTALHTRRVRILKESEKALDDLVGSRDNTKIREFLVNANEDIRASLFESAVLKLTCNNDADTLGAVLDYGKKNELDVDWTKVKVTVDKGKMKAEDFQWMEEEGRGNPIIVASEQASFLSYTFYTFMTKFIIVNDFVGLP